MSYSSSEDSEGFDLLDPDQFLLHLPALRDVQRNYLYRRSLLGSERNDNEFDINTVAIQSSESLLRQGNLFAAFQNTLDHHLECRQVIRADELQKGSTDHLIR